MTRRRRSAEISGELTAARAALDRGDARAALEGLLAAWRDHPAPALADAIEAVGARAAHGLHPPAGVDDEDRATAWFAAAAAGDPAMMHVLVATVMDVDDDDAKVERAAALVAHRDPRVTPRLLELASGAHASPLYRVPTFWRPLYALLESCGDPRVRAGFADLDLARWLRRDTTKKALAVRARTEKAQARLDAVYPTVPALGRDDAATVRAIVELATAPLPSQASDERIEADLLAAVYAVPDDDGPRAIYADWLQERGDPRGELIALQLATHGKPAWEHRAQDDRIDVLLTQHAARWLGPIAACIRRHAFERGFLATCDIAFADEQTRVPTPEDIRWTTVRSVVGGIPATDATPMPVLRSATGLQMAAFEHLARLARPPALTTIGWRSSGVDWTGRGYHPSVRAAIAAFERALPRIPTLRRLVLDGDNAWIAERMPPDRLGWPWRGTSIRELSVRSHFSFLPAWFEAARDEGLASITVKAFVWRATLAGGALDIEAPDRHGFDDGFSGLVAAIEGIPPGGLATVKMELPAKDVWTLDNRRAMARALDRHPGVAIDIRGYVRPKR